jgi:DUF4097 and DUF4098 domain-containing protein YvlB
MKQTLGTLVTIIAAITILLGAAPAGFGQAKSLKVSKGGTLEVRLDGGDIHISTSERDEVTVSGDDESLEVTQSGTTVRVASGSESFGGSVRITIPSQFNIELQTSFGEVQVDGKLAGRVRAETGAGGIALGDVNGTVELSTSGGDLKTGVLNGDGTLRTSGGDIQVKSAGGQLDVKTSGGDIRIGNVGKTLRASTSGGDVSIGDVGGEAKVSTSGGNIRAGKANGKVSLATSGGDIDLEGGNGTVSAATSGGNVNIKDVSGSVDASSAGGEIYAEIIPSGKGKSKLTTAGGNVTLLLPENAKASIEARIRIQRHWRGQHEDFSIQSDFTADKTSENKDEILARYTLNGGGEQITLETVNSDILIKKLRKER